MTDPIRVMIADDEDSVRSTLSSLLSSEPDIVVVGEASDAEGAIEMAASRRPAVAVLDVRMPHGGGLRAASEITERSPETRVLALSGLEDADSILEMIDAGASAYVSKGDDTEKIIEAIHRLADEHEGKVLRLSERPPLEEVFRDTGWMDRRRDRTRRIKEVIRAGGPRLVYQPIFDVTDGKCVGAEALSRFDASPAKTPETWFAEADQVGLQVELELTVVRKALDDLHRFDPDAFVSVNVSPGTCRSEDLVDAIERSSPRRIILEITEHAQIPDYEPITTCLEPLRARGLRMAVDDTGAGFSSMKHVLGFSPELIKLDIELCRDVESDLARRALVRALVRFATSVDADIVAEGIDSQAQLFALRDAGVRYGQGSLLGRPESLPGSGAS